MDAMSLARHARADTHIAVTPASASRSPGAGAAAVPRAGLSLIEVIVSVAILATAISALLGNIYALNMRNQQNIETTRVRDICHQFAERLQGVNWNQIGADTLPWTWARIGPVDANVHDPDGEPDEASDIPGGFQEYNLPLHENAADIEDELLSSTVTDANGVTTVYGLIDEPSGVEDLRIWLEYRRMADFTGANTPEAWRTAMADPDTLVDVQSRESIGRGFDPTNYNEALIVRIVARWTSITGDRRHYEVTFSRRR